MSSCDEAKIISSECLLKRTISKIRKKPETITKANSLLAKSSKDYVLKRYRHRSSSAKSASSRSKHKPQIIINDKEFLKKVNLSPTRISSTQNTATSRSSPQSTPTGVVITEGSGKKHHHSKSAALSPKSNTETITKPSSSTKTSTTTAIPLGRHNTITTSDNIELAVAKDRLKKKVYINPVLFNFILF